MSKSFSFNPEAFAERVGLKVETVKGKLAFDVYAELIQTTPVDTGRAKAGWQITRDKAGDWVPPELPRPPGRKPRSGAYYPMHSVFVPPGRGPVIIYNNVGYIGRLNRGSSQQAPTEFVEIAIDRVLRSADA